MSRYKKSRIVLSVLPLLVFLSVHIAFYWIAYNHSPFELNYFKTYLSGYFEIYLFVGLILMAGAVSKTLFFYGTFFVFAVYGELQMLFGYWKLGPHPTMGPAMMQFALYICGFIIGVIVEVLARVVNNNLQKNRQN